MHKSRACMQDEQAEASSMASPERATRQRNIPSLSPLNIARQLSPPAASPSHLASEVPCPVPDVGQHDAVMLGATNDLNAGSDHSVGVDHTGDSDLDEQCNGDIRAEYLGEPHQAVRHADHDMTAARFHNGPVLQADPCDLLEDLDSPDEAMSEEDECEGAAAANSQSRAQAVHHHSAGAGAELGEAVAEEEEEPSRARQHSASGSASVSASESASPEVEAAAGPSLLPTADMQIQDQAEPVRRRWAAGAHLSSEGGPDSPSGEAELPEEGWMWYSASLLTSLYC